MSNGQETVEPQDADMTKNVTDQLREAIAQANTEGITYQELAEKADLSKGVIAAFMAPNGNKGTITLATAEKLAKALKIQLRIG